MNKDAKDKYIYTVIMRSLAILVVVLIALMIYRFDVVKAGAEKVTNILMPFLYGGVIAYLLKPATLKFESYALIALEGCFKTPETHKKVSRGIGITFSMLMFAAIIYAFLAFAVPQILESVASIIHIMPSNINRASEWLSGLAGNDVALQNLINRSADTILVNFEDWIQNSVMPNIQTYVAEVTTQVWNMVIAAKNLLIGLVACVYLLYNMDHLAYQGKLILLGVFGKEWSMKIRNELYIVDQMFTGFIVGKLIDSLIIGVICMIVMSLLDWPFVMLISTIVGVFNIIPFFGPFIGAVPSAFLMLMVSPRHMIYFLIFILILQQFDGNILGPKILGNRTGISGLWILFSITLFGGLFGLVGMVIGVPLFAVIYDVIKKLVKNSMRMRNISEEEQEELVKKIKR